MMTAEEAFYSQDLYLRGYAGKWREAKRMTHRQKPELDGLPYWLEVRQCYLELGGYYISQINEFGQPICNHHPA